MSENCENPKMRTYDREKNFHKFGSSPWKRKPFELVEKAQRLHAQITEAVASCDRRYRLTICQDFRFYARDLVHAIRFANSCRLGDVRRAEMQHRAAELIEKIYDEIPALRMCKCYTEETEAKIEKSLLYLKISFEGWLKSDLKRLTECKKGDFEVAQMRASSEERYKKALDKLNVTLFDYFPQKPKPSK